MFNNFLTKIVQLPKLNTQFVRFPHTKHWSPKWKKLRREKVIKMDFAAFEENPEKMTNEEKRTKMKNRGIYPQKQWMEKPMYLSCTGGIFEPYVPPEGDGKFSFVSVAGAKQNVEMLTKKSKSFQALRKIRRYEEEFNHKDFAHQAVDIYKGAHEALLLKDKDKLREFATERLFPEMLYNLDNKIIKWKFIQSIEPPRVVQARITKLLTETNMFGQVTVRLHTQQLLALYDRFGRLMSGSEILAKDALEYVVLEKHLSNEYGVWRIHAKIIPDWMPPKPSIEKTFVLEQPAQTAPAQIEPAQTEVTST